MLLRPFLPRRTLKNLNHVWLLLEMADRSLVSVRNVELNGLKMSVGIQSNGIYLYKHWVTVSNPPSRDSIVHWVKPKEIRIEHMLEIFERDPMLAAEVHASWCMMRRELLNVIYGGRYGEGDLAGVSAY